MKFITCFLLILILFASFVSPVFAIGEFGGRVGATFICLNGIKFFLIPPSSAGHLAGTYIFRWGTLLYKWWRLPRLGLNIIGKSVPGGCCWVLAPHGAQCLPVSRTIIFMGTSK